MNSRNWESREQIGVNQFMPPQISSQGSIEVAPKYVQRFQKRQLTPLKKASTSQSNKDIPNSQEQELDALVKTPKRNNIISAFHHMIVKRNIRRFRDLLNIRKVLQKRLRYPHYAAIRDSSFDLDSIESEEKAFYDPYLKKVNGNQLVKQAKRRLYKWKNAILNSAIVIVVINTLDDIAKKIPIFQPESRKEILWSFFSFIAQMFLLIFIPIQLAYNNQFLSHHYYPLMILACAFCFADLFNRLNTGFLKHGRVCTKRWEILIYNVQDWILLDMASIIIVVVVNVEAHLTDDVGKAANRRNFTEFIMLIYFTQFRHILRLRDKFEQQFNMNLNTRCIYQIVKLMLTMIYLEHLFSSIWSFIGLIEQENDGYNWIQFKGLVGRDWTLIYLESIYYTTVTLTSVGYGDISPQTSTEKIFCLFFMLISSVQLSYSVSHVGTIISELTESSSLNLRKIRVINNYMHRQGVSLKLQHRITEYLLKYWEERDDFLERDHVPLIEDLSDDLKESLMLETNLGVFQKIPFIQDTFSDQVKLELVQYVETVNMRPEQTITLYKDSDKSNIYLYYIDEGEVEEFYQLNQRNDFVLTKNTFRQGHHLNIDPFIKGVPSKENYRCIGFCKFQRISRFELLKVLKEFPIDHEIFQQIKDEQINSKVIQQPCVYCRLGNHPMSECPTMHYIPDKEKVIKTSQFHHNQERDVYDRLLCRSINSLRLLPLVKQQADRLQLNERNPYEVVYETDEDDGSLVDTSDEETSVIQPQVAIKHREKNVRRSFKISVGHLQDVADNLEYKHKFHEKQELYRQEKLLWRQKIAKLLTKHQNRFTKNFSSREIDNLKFLHLTLSKTIKFVVEDNFESVRNFNSYMPQNNISVVVRDEQLRLRQTLINYMNYPRQLYDYFSKANSKPNMRQRMTKSKSFIINNIGRAKILPKQ